MAMQPMSDHNFAIYVRGINVVEAFLFQDYKNIHVNKNYLQSRYMNLYISNKSLFIKSHKPFYTHVVYYSNLLQCDLNTDGQNEDQV